MFHPELFTSKHARLWYWIVVWGKCRLMPNYSPLNIWMGYYVIIADKILEDVVNKTFCFPLKWGRSGPDGFFSEGLSFSIPCRVSRDRKGSWSVGRTTHAWNWRGVFEHIYHFFYFLFEILLFLYFVHKWIMRLFERIIYKWIH